MKINPFSVTKFILYNTNQALKNMKSCAPDQQAALNKIKCYDR